MICIAAPSRRGTGAGGIGSHVNCGAGKSENVADNERSGTRTISASALESCKEEEEEEDGKTIKSMIIRSKIKANEVPGKIVEEGVLWRRRRHWRGG